jgi:imidazolonepropionase-like amidohydrolase
MATGGVMDPMSDYRVQELSEEQMARAVELAHRAGKRVMAHAEGTAGIKAAVRAGVDSIEHGTVLDEEGAALMEARGTWLVPTLFTFQHGVEVGASQGADPVSVEKGRVILKLQQPAFALALKHHLKIAYGVDDDPDFVSKEFGALVPPA